MSDTKSTQYKIREAQIEDAARLVEIYSHYITDTAVSFEYEVPSVDEFKARITKSFIDLIQERSDHALIIVPVSRINRLHGSVYHRVLLICETQALRIHCRSTFTYLSVMIETIP